MTTATTAQSTQLGPQITTGAAYETLRARGFLYQCSDEAGLAEALGRGPVTYYVGFDPTAPSLHIGHLLPIMAMAHLQRAGHHPIALVGGGTTMVGDPTGRMSARPILTREEIEANATHIRGQLSHFLDLSPGNGFLVDNADWLLPLNYIAFLRDYGRHFSVNEMLRAEAYKARLETGLSFLEFNYMLLQAYDFLEAFRRYGCTVQLGGSDQWSNILAGADLIRRVEGHAAFALTTPLLLTQSGEKMGKTAGGARVWLDRAQTSPFAYYQFWVNCDDTDVEPLLRFFTYLPLDEVRDLVAMSGEGLRPAKRRLALEATALLHGQADAEAACDAARALFGDADVGQASLEVLAHAESIPTVPLDASRLEAGLGILDALVVAGLSASKGAARRLVEGGGAAVNEARAELSTVLTPTDLHGGVLILRAGKKRYVRLAIDG
jgi:tyrosyl-tRNA synthetase